MIRFMGSDGNLTKEAQTCKSMRRLSGRYQLWSWRDRTRGDKSLDKVPFEKIRKEIINQYNRGGLVSLSWHPRNPKTGGDAWDVSDHAVVKSILPEGENYEKFQSWLGKVNDFILSLKTSDGTKIPVLFRPWHEHTGSWFWWGQNLCTTDEYKALWRMTADYLNAHGAADQIVYAYSTGTEPRIKRLIWNVTPDMTWSTS